MPGTNVLVLGGTGPAGICLLRELLHRKHATVAYARNTSKIPSELSNDPNLEVIKGEMNDREALSLAISKSNVIISLLGPNQMRLSSYTIYPDFYRIIFRLMREHHVSRIYAMGTISISQPKDHFSWIRSLLVWLVYLVAHSAWRNIIGVGKVFELEAQNLDWTVFRIGGIPGGSDEVSWARDREAGAVAGWVGDDCWSISLKRSGLAKWLVDCIEGAGEVWVGLMPAVSRDAKPEKKTL